MTMDERMYYKDHLKNLEDEITNLSSNLTEIEVKQIKTVSKSTEEELLYLIEKERILKETKGFILQKKLD